MALENHRGDFRVPEIPPFFKKKKLNYFQRVQLNFNGCRKIQFCNDRASETFVMFYEPQQKPE